MKLAVIGAGQLGSRHLQALSLLDSENIHIQVLDLNQASLEVAEQRMKAMNYESNRFHVDYISDYKELYSDIDVVVIATGADVRFRAISSLLEVASVRYLILEKVLFQTELEYAETFSLLEKHDVAAWVNCPQRTWDIYQQIRAEITQDSVIEMSVTGGQWGLACNAIHYIDLFAFLSESPVLNVSTERLLPKTVPSKRDSFIELVGTMTAWTENGSHLILRSFEESDAPVLVTIDSGTHRFTIRENERHFMKSSGSKGWCWDEDDYKVPYQSEATNRLVEQLMASGTCSLSTYSDSMSLHLPLIRAINNYLTALTNTEVTKCPIT
ncbi:MAG: Gfo/Idh/MocA family oxidoreductase [Aestuariibacter sp.]